MLRQNRLQVEPACCWDERRAVAWAFAHTLRSDVVSELKVSPGSALPCPPPGPQFSRSHTLTTQTATKQHSAETRQRYCGAQQ